MKTPSSLYRFSTRKLYKLLFYDPLGIFMFLCKHRTIIFLSGTIWLSVGIFLLVLGLNFIMSSLSFPQISSHFSLLDLFGQAQNIRERGAILLISCALVGGFLKGKYVLSKSAAREIQRITKLPDPTTIKHFYGKKYYFIFSSMVLLGMLMRHLPISCDTRGFIDVIIGSALIQGALFYFRYLISIGKSKNYG